MVIGIACIQKNRCDAIRTQSQILKSRVAKKPILRSKVNEFEMAANDEIVAFEEITFDNVTIILLQ